VSIIIIERHAAMAEVLNRCYGDRQIEVVSDREKQIGMNSQCGLMSTGEGMAHFIKDLSHPGLVRS
jgi:hypothetical protein